LKLICDVAIKPVPVTLNVNELLPIGPDDGEILVIAGTGLLAAPIVKVAAGLVPPPGAGLTTVTCTTPVTFGSEDTVAVKEPFSCRVVVSSKPPKSICDEATKPVPVTVTVNEPLPSGSVEGEMALITGDGLVTAKVAAELVPPPGAGLVTVTDTGPATTGSDDTVADREPSLLSVVVSGEPLKLICEYVIKPVPVKVNVNGPLPTGSVDGVRLAIVGAGLFDDAIVNVNAALVPPPGAGLITVTLTGPVTLGSEATAPVNVPSTSSVVVSS